MDSLPCLGCLTYYFALTGGIESSLLPSDEVLQRLEWTLLPCREKKVQLSQYAFMRKTLNKLEIEGNILNMIKRI